MGFSKANTMFRQPHHRETDAVGNHQAVKHISMLKVGVLNRTERRCNIFNPAHDQSAGVATHGAMLQHLECVHGEQAFFVVCAFLSDAQRVRCLGPTPLPGLVPSLSQKVHNCTLAVASSDSC